MKDKFIPVCIPDLTGNEKKYLQECIDTGWVSSQGRFVTKFEEDFAKYCNMKYGVAVNSGTSALHLALLTLGIGKGDEVILPTFTFIATALAVIYLRAKPMFVERKTSLEAYCYI